ncbi:hypothetical protein J6TS1_19140 [Siminovitchia terrae]|uniref:Sortase n=1 Tax=Siminovitchia terrae TaxID=1914933 RepID=A0ABQ4KWJ1_SIMTE|nr:sortase [Siminovitchia terrae]GIN96044.1 hypothetical protein J6TS1_19140 [Siminovitchia terrae]
MKNIKSFLGLIFLFAGLILISIPLYHDWQQAQELRALEEALSLLSEGSSDSNHSSFTEERLKTVLELEIPSIDLKQKVLNETTEENLNIALTQLKKDQTPGKGNFAIAGHRGYRGDRHFRNLPNVQYGEKVYLHSKDETYVYKVTASKIIQPTEVEVIDDKKDKNEITMITCTIDGSERIAVKGELIETIKK